MTHSTTFPPRLSTERIEKGRWTRFLADFTTGNRGAHARLEVFGESIDGYFVPSEDKPFDGISADVRDRETVVWIFLGAGPADRVSHGINDASGIWTRPASGSQGAVIEIDSADGTRTILSLSPPEAYALPEGESRP